MGAVFEFTDYAAYLARVFARANPAGRKRSELCQYLRCQPSFISQVFSRKAHITLEHGILISRFLKHEAHERKYFILLVQLAKAGSAILRTHFEEQLHAELKRREPVAAALKIQGQLTPENQAVYYSQWWYSAIHILVAFPEIKTASDICHRLRLHEDIVTEALQFLDTRGLIVSTNGEWQIGRARVHLGSRSPLIARHHMNWRVKCLDALEQRGEGNLHYSAVIGISRDGARAIAKAMTDLIVSSEEVVRATTEEAPFVLLMDFFEL